jgi:hypothetical protein
MRKADLVQLEDGLEDAVRAVETVLTEGAHVAMRKFNKKVNSEQ